jgi:transposase
MTYSKDLRSRALYAYYEDDISFKEICKTFHISHKTYYNWRQEFDKMSHDSNKNNDIDDYKCNKISSIRKLKKPKYSDDLITFIKAYIINKHNFRMKNLLTEIKEKYNISLNDSNIYYILKKNNVTFKKAKYETIKDPVDYKIKVDALINTVNTIGTDNIVSIDECHFEVNMSPNNGWSLKGGRTVFTKKSGNRTRISLICAINKKKVVYYEMIEGTVNSSIYLQFLKNLNKRCRNKTYLMDNARTHHAKIVKKHMSKCSNKILYNVAYSQKTNPIELNFSKIKTYVKKENTETLLILVGMQPFVQQLQIYLPLIIPTIKCI